MSDILKKFYLYYLNNNKKKSEFKELKELVKKNNLDLKKIQSESMSHIDKIKNKAQKLGYEVDFESFYNMLQDYIQEKDNLSESNKKDYLFILASLSEIYDINLRQELENYVSLKNPQTQGELIIKYCRFLLDESNKEDYNTLIQLINLNKLDINIIQIKANKEVEKIKRQVKKYGFNTDLKSYYKMLEDYKDKKNNLSDKEKEKYLRLLLLLSKIYNIDIRKYLTDSLKSEKKSLNNLTNPLEDNQFLKTLLLYRYNNGFFQVNELSTLNDKPALDTDNCYDFVKIKAKLLLRIIYIYLDKINNYCFEDINSNFSIKLNDEDYTILKELNLKKVITFINEIENKEDIIEKLNLNDNTYAFLKETLLTIDFENENIGTITNNLFNFNNEPFTINIYLNNPNSQETTLFFSEYIYQCIINNISYSFKSSNQYSINKDRTILYANQKDLLTKINILDEIATKHPEWIEKFGTPLHSGAKFKNSYYCISFSSLNNNKNTCKIDYNDYFNYLSEVAYYRTLAKLIITKVKKEADLTIIKDFIDYKDVSYLNNNDLYSISINKIEFAKIKDLVNSYIPEVSRTLNMYFENESKLDVLTKEFQKSLMYLANIINGKNKKESINIAINNII